MSIGRRAGFRSREIGGVMVQVAVSLRARVFVAYVGDRRLQIPLTEAEGCYSTIGGSVNRPDVLNWPAIERLLRRRELIGREAASIS